MTGPFMSTGVQINAAVKLFLQENGSSVAGQKIEIVLKDDGGVPEQTKRLAQELVVNEKVDALAGFGITPAALAASTVATQAKVPAIIMAAATSGIVASSPYFVRTSYTMTQSAGTMAEWVVQQKFNKVVTMVSDYGPGIDAEKIFKERVEQGGVQVVGEIRVPMRNPDFSPFLQKVNSLRSDDAKGGAINLLEKDWSHLADKLVQPIQAMDPVHFEQFSRLQKQLIQQEMSIAYSFMFAYCAIAYLLAWSIMKWLVPKEKIINLP
jgi:ABC-type branched-subunit amino acid transport system substrate-binding protein